MGLGTFIGKMLGGGAVEIASGIGGVVDKFMETPDEKRAAEIVMAKLENNKHALQTEINKIEAGHRSLFIAGWRPAVGWICVFALAWNWILFPLLQFFYTERALPSLDVGDAIALVMALLGVAGIRTYEKRAGLTK